MAYSCARRVQFAADPTGNRVLTRELGIPLTEQADAYVSLRFLSLSIVALIVLGWNPLQD
jgi:hypothetical protein